MGESQIWDNKAWSWVPRDSNPRGSKSKLRYYRRSIDQSILVSSTHLGPKIRFLLLSDSRGFVDVGRLLWREMGLSFTIAAGPRQRSHSRYRVPQDSWPYLTVSDSRFPQPVGPGPRIYILQEQSDPVIPLDTGFPFHRLLRIAGLRWRYSNPPPRGEPQNVP
jgi:hypothetical protein